MLVFAQKLQNSFRIFNPVESGIKRIVHRKKKLGTYSLTNFMPVITKNHNNYEINFWIIY